MAEFNGNGDDEIIDFHVRSIDKIDSSLYVIKISKKFAIPLYQCFYIMSLEEIEVFLAITSFDENHKIWTWKDLKQLTLDIIYDENYASYKKLFEIDYDDSLDKIIGHHVNPRRRTGKSKEERNIKVRRSKKYEDFFHYCFWHMYIEEIITFLEIVFNPNSSEVWTWNKLIALRKDIIDGYGNQYINEEEVEIHSGVESKLYIA